MADIVIFGGTSEGRKLAESFCEMNVQVHICVATEYGADLLPKHSHLHVHTGRMDAARMEEFLMALSADYCLDATHPYAVEVTENICQACHRRGIPYIRVPREDESLMYDGKRDGMQGSSLFYELPDVEADRKSVV